jgi:hypothetical protein
MSLNYNEMRSYNLGNFSVSGGVMTCLLSSSGQRRRYISKGAGGFIIEPSAHYPKAKSYKDYRTKLQ